MGNPEVNSQAYWENRFETDWEAARGDAQTRYFARLALDLLPGWLKEEAGREGYSLCDAGCGQGESLEILGEVFPADKLSGFDFSGAAMEKARQNYPQYHYFTADLLALEPANLTHFDVIFCSNTLEHFKEPFPLWEKLAVLSNRYLIVMVPYNEVNKLLEHELRYTLGNIPLSPGGSVLIHVATSLDMDSDLYADRQILLVYAKKPPQGRPLFLADVAGAVAGDSQQLQNEVKRNHLHIRQLEANLSASEAEQARMAVQLAGIERQQVKIYALREEEIEKLKSMQVENEILKTLNEQLNTQNDILQEENQSILSSISYRVSNGVSKLLWPFYSHWQRLKKG